MIVGQSNQQLQHQNFLQSQHQKVVSSPSPDFSVSPTSSSTSNNSNIQHQSKDPSFRQDVVTPSPNEVYQNMAVVSQQNRGIRPPTRRTKWKSQQNLAISGIGNPYPTNNQFFNQPPAITFPPCQSMHHQTPMVLSNPVVAASCCLHQHQDPFGNIYFVPQKPALDLGLCRGCRKIYASSPMIQNSTLSGVSCFRRKLSHLHHPQVPVTRIAHSKALKKFDPSC